MKNIIIITILLTQSLFGLISVTPVEIGKKAGFHGKVALSLETKRGNSHKDNYKGALRIVYDDNASFAVWAEVSSSYGEVNDVENTKKSYLHIRYIHAITPVILRGELFAQIEDDKFKLIDSRELFGAGVRLKLFDLTKSMNGYFGTGAMKETVSYTSAMDIEEDSVRVNSYLTYKYYFSKKSSLSYSFYYQPKIDDFGDVVQTHSALLKVPVYKKLSLQISASYNSDSEPPIGVDKYSFSQNTSFVFSF